MAIHIDDLKSRNYSKWVTEYGDWKTTGAVERRKHGKLWRIYDECECWCGTKKFVLRDNLLAGTSQRCGEPGCSGKTRKPKIGLFYVEHVSASLTPAWAKSDLAETANPWICSWSEPPHEAHAFPNKETALDWIYRRTNHRRLAGLPMGKYQVREF